jgi:uncharacterized coiled-coil DUF342 family protein
LATATTEEVEALKAELESAIEAAQAAAEGNAGTDVLVSEAAALKVKEREYQELVERVRVKNCEWTRGGFN